MNAVSDVSVEPKNAPTPNTATTSISMRGRSSSRAGAIAPRSDATGTTRPVGCSANAVTKMKLSAAAAAIGAQGATTAASTPTTNGPITNAVSSAADSYAIAREKVRSRRSDETRAPMSAMTRLRDIAAVCGPVRPIATALARTTASAAGDPTTTGKSARRMPLASPVGTSTRDCPNRSARSPSTGPAMTTPMPTAADVSPPSATEPRTDTTRARTPTVIIANGRRATNATGKYQNPVWWISERDAAVGTGWCMRISGAWGGAALPVR